MLEHMLDRIPVNPVVVHIYPPEHRSDSKDMNDVIFVEKKGSSDDHTKQTPADN